MGSDEEKTEKKRLKAEYKLEKKRLKLEEEKQKQASQPKEEQKKEPEAPQPRQQKEPSTIIVNVPKERWFEDPRWIAAIIGAISLTVTLIIYLYG